MSRPRNDLNDEDNISLEDANEDQHSNNINQRKD